MHSRCTWAVFIQYLLSGLCGVLGPGRVGAEESPAVQRSVLESLGVRGTSRLARGVVVGGLASAIDTAEHTEQLDSQSHTTRIRPTFGTAPRTVNEGMTHTFADAQQYRYLVREEDHRCHIRASSVTHSEDQTRDQNSYPDKTHRRNQAQYPGRIRERRQIPDLDQTTSIRTRTFPPLLPAPSKRQASSRRRTPDFVRDCVKRGIADKNYYIGYLPGTALCQDEDMYMLQCVHPDGIAGLVFDFRCRADEFCETVDQKTNTVWNPESKPGNETFRADCIKKAGAFTSVLLRLSYGVKKWATVFVSHPRGAYTKFYGKAYVHGDAADTAFTIRWEVKGVDGPVSATLVFDSMWYKRGFTGKYASLATEYDIPPGNEGAQFRASVELDQDKHEHNLHVGASFGWV